MSVHSHDVRISKTAYSSFLNAVTHQSVQETLAASKKSGGDDAWDFVASALRFVLSPECCPKCKRAFEHSGSCTAMSCPHPDCKTKFCMWCRKIIRGRCTLLICKSTHHLAGEGPNSKPGDLNAIAHNHVFDCEKRPTVGEILTDSVLFPAGSEENDGDFMDAFFKIRKLRVLKAQMKEWTAADCKRLVMHEHFQGLLISIQQRQTKFREFVPEKPQLLKFPFFKASASVHLI